MRGKMILASSIVCISYIYGVQNGVGQSELTVRSQTPEKTLTKSGVVDSR